MTAYIHPPLGSLSEDKRPSHDEKKSSPVITKRWSLFLAAKYTPQTQLLRSSSQLNAYSWKAPENWTEQGEKAQGCRRGHQGVGDQRRPPSKRLLASVLRLSRPAGTGTQ